MFYLLATILLNVVISVILKVFAKYNINALQAIVANYWVCVITGSIFIGEVPVSHAILHQSWFPWSLLMGAGFICIFNLMAYCTRIDGITTMTIANKLSIVIPVLFSIFLYNDQIGIGKVIGILVAFPAVYLTTRVKGEQEKAQSLLWPILLFIGSGLLDTLVKFVQNNYLSGAEQQAIYTIYSFAAAGAVGTVIIISLVVLRKTTLQWRNLIAGICIGIPNYFSIYLLIRMLNSNFLQSSAAIPVNNIGILVASSLVAILFFREKVTMPRAIGLLLSVAAILLIAFGDKGGFR